MAQYTFLDGTTVELPKTESGKLKFLAELKDASPQDYQIILHSNWIKDEQWTSTEVPTGIDRALVGTGAGLTDFAEGAKNLGLGAAEYVGAVPEGTTAEHRAQRYKDLALYEKGRGEDAGTWDWWRMGGNIAAAAPMAGLAAVSGAAPLTAAIAGAGAEGLIQMPQEEPSIGGSTDPNIKRLENAGINALTAGIIDVPIRYYGHFRDKREAKQQGFDLPPDAQARADFAKDRFGIEMTTGQATRDPGILALEKKYGYFGNLGERFKQNEAILQQNLDKTPINPYQIGESVGANVSAQQVADRNRVSALYQTAFDADPGYTFDVSGLKEVVDSMKGEKSYHWNNPRLIPKNVKNAIEDVFPTQNRKGATVAPRFAPTGERLMIIDQEINRAWPDVKSTDGLSYLKRTVLDLLENAENAAHSPELAKAYEVARKEGQRVEAKYGPQVVQDMMDKRISGHTITKLMGNSVTPDDMQHLVSIITPESRAQLIDGLKHYINYNTRSAGGWGKVQPNSLRSLLNRAGMREKLAAIMDVKDHQNLYDLARVVDFMDVDTPLVGVTSQMEQGAHMFGAGSRRTAEEVMDMGLISEGTRRILRKWLGNGVITNSLLSLEHLIGTSTRDEAVNLFEELSLAGRKHTGDVPPPAAYGLPPSLPINAATDEYRRKNQ